jgi:hypothetical protein
MFAHSSSLNFYKSMARKHQQKMKCHNGDGGPNGSIVQMELECKRDFNFE